MYYQNSLKEILTRENYELAVTAISQNDKAVIEYNEISGLAKANLNELNDLSVYFKEIISGQIKNGELKYKNVLKKFKFPIGNTNVSGCLSVRPISW